MQVEVWQVLTPDDLGKGRCCTCGLVYGRSVAEIQLLTEYRLDLGELCPACLERGPEHIERWIRYRAEQARTEAEELERVASEYVEDCPSVEVYRMLERAIGEPRYGSLDEADGAYGFD